MCFLVFGHFCNSCRKKNNTQNYSHTDNNKLYTMQKDVRDHFLQGGALWVFVGGGMTEIVPKWADFALFQNFTAMHQLASESVKIICFLYMNRTNYEHLLSFKIFCISWKTSKNIKWKTKKRKDKMSTLKILQLILFESWLYLPLFSYTFREIKFRNGSGNVRTCTVEDLR